MQTSRVGPWVRVLSWPLLVMTAGAQMTDETYELVEMPAFPVAAPFTANLEPAASFAAPVTRLRYAPEVDIQSRGLPEAQSDLAIRGGVFEQTSLVMGAIPFFDPQTGHYAAEVPFAPEMLTEPRLALGTANAVEGFNSAVGTVRYGWSRIEARGTAAVGFGSDAMRYGSLYQGLALSHRGETRWSLDFSAAHAEGDGTVEQGDYELSRFAGRLQRSSGRSQTDLYAGYLDKFYGWPGLYIANAYGSPFPETDDYQAKVLGLNHRQTYGVDSHWEASAAFREMDDDYEFNREAPSRAFEHLTRVWSAGLGGRHEFSTRWGVSHRLTLLHDDLVRSTSLTFGDPSAGNDFTERGYLHLAILPEYRWTDAGDARWTVAAGVMADASTEDSGFVGGLFRLERLLVGQSGSWTAFLDLSQASQVPGYTALRSNPVGLFGGNPGLGREYASTAELGLRWEQGPWMLSGAVFGRYDDDLVDWTFSADSPSARRANPVEVETLGVEWIARYAIDRWELQLSYAYLSKDADYQSAAFDASFYALNYARHRATLSAIYRVRENLDLRADLEARAQVENLLRTSDTEAMQVALSANWHPAFREGLELSFLVDNLTDSDFQEFPGTPAVGRHWSIRLGYRW